MADVLIRNVPEAVLAGVDAHAARLGLARRIHPSSAGLRRRHLEHARLGPKPAQVRRGVR
jgi:hypothetical protein